MKSENRISSNILKYKLTRKGHQIKDIVIWTYTTHLTATDAHMYAH